MDFKKLIEKANTNVKKASKRLNKVNEEIQEENHRKLQKLADVYKRDKSNSCRKLLEFGHADQHQTKAKNDSDDPIVKKNRQNCAGATLNLVHTNQHQTRVRNNIEDLTIKKDRQNRDLAIVRNLKMSETKNNDGRHEHVCAMSSNLGKNNIKRNGVMIPTKNSIQPQIRKNCSTAQQDAFKELMQMAEQNKNVFVETKDVEAKNFCSQQKQPKPLENDLGISASIDFSQRRQKMTPIPPPRRTNTSLNQSNNSRMHTSSNASCNSLSVPDKSKGQNMKISANVKYESQAKAAPRIRSGNEDKSHKNPQSQRHLPNNNSNLNVLPKRNLLSQLPINNSLRNPQVLNPTNTKGHISDRSKPNESKSKSLHHNSETTLTKKGCPLKADKEELIRQRMVEYEQKLRRELLNDLTSERIKSPRESTSSKVAGPRESTSSKVAGSCAAKVNTKSYVSANPKALPSISVPRKIEKRTAEHHHSIPQQRSKQQLVYSSDTEGDDEEIYPNRSFYCEDDEYDSEMDDFIDDSMVDDFQREDFEETLRQLNPRYDKKKWMIREAMIDERKMHAKFSDIEKEEFISAKLGIVEDIKESKRGSRALK